MPVLSFSFLSSKEAYFSLKLGEEAGTHHQYLTKSESAGIL